MLVVEALIFLLGLIIAISLHEAAHCFMADYLGDPTPRAQGRTTLDPRVHLDPIGSVLLPFLGFISNSPVLFGWGKPAPFDPFNLQNPKRDTALIAIAGPVTNLLLAILFSLIIHLLPLPTFLTFVLAYFIQINVSLAVFNLLPVPPLDGSKIVGLFMSHETGYRYQHLTGPNSYLLIFLLILPLVGGHSLATILVSPPANFLLNLLLR